VKLVCGSVSNWIQSSATGFFDRYKKIRGLGWGHVGFPGANIFQVDFGVLGVVVGDGFEPSKA
jgi:hypothetical protein